jgi:uncharacterized protein (DUF983 family)
MSSSPFLRGLFLGARRRCPECGEGKLFRGYLKVQPVCEVCGHDNGRYPSDDAPPYFTILIVGHLVVAPMLVFPFIWQWPAWLVLSITLPILLVLTLLILPRVKGAVIGGHWAVGHRHPESELVAAPPAP